MTDTVVQSKQKEVKIEIPGYQVLRELGQGGMATVYLAVQQGFEREIALKVMSKSLAADDEYRQRFYREAKIVGQLSHPHIVPVYDVGYHEGDLYLAMEYLKCGDLAQRIKQNVTPVQALAISKQIAQALSFAHEHGFIHRDVKPDNILFRDENTAVLTDFGIARTQDASGEVTAVQSIIGTPRYMSPEQALAEPLDARTDIYSLGVVLYEMLTGELPFTGTNATTISLQHCSKPIPLLPDDLAMMQPLINKLLAKSRTDRIRNAKNVLSAISRLQSGLGVEFQSPLQKSLSTTTLKLDGVRVPTLTSKKWFTVSLTVLTILAVSLLTYHYLPARQESFSSETSHVTAGRLAGAWGALSEGRLQESANLFTDVIEVDNNNAAASEGLLQLELTYIDAIETGFAANDIGKLERLVEQFAEFFPTNEDLQRFRSRLEIKLANLRLQNAQTKHIQALLAKAKQALNSGQYFSPRYRSAFDYFSQIAAIDTANTSAKKGLEGIMAYTLNQAVSLTEAKKYDRARVALNNARRIEPSHPVLINAEKALEDARAADIEEQQALKKERSEKLDSIAALLKKAYTQVRQGVLTEPAENNAYNTYIAILNIDSGNEKAMQGLNNITSIVLDKAQQAIDEKSFGRAERQLAMAYNVMPSHPGIDLQQKELRRAKQQEEERITRLGRVRDLLSAIKDIGVTTNSTFKELSKAATYYQEVLSLDSDNSDAQDGLDLLVEQHLSRARMEIQDADFINARNNLAAAQSLSPQNNEVQSLLNGLSSSETEWVTQQTVNKLTVNAERFLKQGEFEKANDNYREVLELLPNSKQAIEGLKQIKTGLRQQITASITKLQLSRAESLLKQGKTLFPQEVTWVELGGSIKNARAALEKEQVDKAQRIEKLLELAKSQYQNDKLVKPKNDCVFRTKLVTDSSSNWTRIPA